MAQLIYTERQFTIFEKLGRPNSVHLRSGVYGIRKTVLEPCSVDYEVLKTMTNSELEFLYRKAAENLEKAYAKFLLSRVVAPGGFYDDKTAYFYGICHLNRIRLVDIENILSEREKGGLCG